ncbi:MAG: hypothetical protein ACP8RL_00215 [cyanobacterium endosymbiont of Rhopalodia inflata]
MNYPGTVFTQLDDCCPRRVLCVFIVRVIQRWSEQKVTSLV